MTESATGERHRLPADVAERVPHGWYRLDPQGAAALEQGEVVDRTLGGREIVLWTGPDGAVAADAHCPHLGAHLGHGGTIEDGCLRCPFHGWRWGADGSHLEIPGHDTVTNARLTTLPVCEIDDGVLVWSGTPDSSWVPTELTADVPADAVDLGGLDGSGEGLHLAMMEGIVDVAHFPTLHGLRAPAVETLEFGDAPGASVRLRLDSGAVADLTFDGLSRVCERMTHRDYTLWMVGEYWLSAPDRATGAVRFWGHGPTRAGVDRLHRMFLRVYERQANEDEAIWRHRRYDTPQAYGPDDRPVVAFRRWAAQFFDDDAGDGDG